MQKSAFERTGLVPRSIIRTFDRFRRQLLPGAEDLVIQEFRVSKYQVLVSVRCLASLLFFPLLVNYLVKTTILIPLAEYIWNTQQSEIFLNFYQENRAFLEMRDFEEKTFFESLVSVEPKQSDYNTLVLHKTQNDFELIPIKSSKMRSFHPVKKQFFNGQIDFSKRNLNLSKILREKGTFIKNKIDNFVDLSETSKICLPKSILAATLPLETLNSQNSTKNCNSQNGTFNYVPNLKDSFLNLPQKRDISKFFPIELKELNSKKINLEKLNLVDVAGTSALDRVGRGDFFSQTEKDTFFYQQNVESKSKFGKVLLNFSVTNPFFVGNKKEITQDYDCTFYKTKCKEDTIVKRNQGLMPKCILANQLCEKYEVFDGAKMDFDKQKKEATVFVSTKNNSLSFENKKTNKIDEILLQKKFQEKTIQLAAFYNQQTISAIANVFGDFVTLVTIAFLFVLMKPQIIILKSFLTESIYSLSDTTKSFLLILLTDLLVGFHSPRGWEILIEILLRHFGLPENQDFVFLFVATLPVLLDTVFKYWIFRYLNQISPSTVATYHSMIE